MVDNTDTGRGGRARERIKKRKQRQAQLKQAGERINVPQLKPAVPKRINLPQIDVSPMVLRNVGAGLGGALLVVLIVVALRAFNPPAPALLPNALWLGTEWTYNEPTDEQIDVLVERLRANEIGSVYAWVTFLREDGTWSGRSDSNLGDVEANVQRFVAQFNDAYPEARLYGWISFPTAPPSVSEYRLADDANHERIAELAKVLVDSYGFDAIYLNVEPVQDGDENFLQLLRTTRALLGDDIRIAVAIPPDWSPLNPTIPVPPLIRPGTEWSTAYKQSVALLADELLIMAYNSGLNNARDYSAWTAYQVQAYANAVNDLGVETDVVIGVPTYDAEPPGHDPLVENISSSVAGVRSGLLQAGEAADTVRGLAIYAEWETDNTEWSTFNQQWVRASEP